MSNPLSDRWSEGDPYERYVGRWSRRVAREFVQWLAVAPDCTWADVGCGTGALTEAILGAHHPRTIHSIDSSGGFLATASARLTDARLQWHLADATALPLPDASCDATVSGLVLNFIAAPERMVAEMVRVTRPAGWAASYVWDYAVGMQMMRLFWDAATLVTPQAEALDEATRFPICSAHGLQTAWTAAGLQHVETRPIVIETLFADFDDFWRPFLGRQGAAPTFLATLSQVQQDEIRDALSRTVVRDSAGRIALEARAWAVKGQLRGILT